jgi:hypothetical protein
MITKNVELNIQSVRIKRMLDDNPDTSYLGVYTNDIRPGVIIREHDEFYERIPTEMDRDCDGRFIGKAEPTARRGQNGWAGFEPANHVPHDPKNWKHVSPAGKMNAYKKYGSLKNADYAYALQDYHRFEELVRGDWYYIGIIVEATVSISVAGVPLNSITVRSGGLWGIESDIGDESINETISGEKFSLRAKLRKMGFPNDQIDAAFKDAKVIEVVTCI